MQSSAALAEAHGLVAAALHLPHHENPERDHQNDGGEIHQHREPAAGGRIVDRHGDAAILEFRVKLGISGGNDRVVLVFAVHVIALDLGRVDIGGLDIARVHIVQELREVERAIRFAMAMIDDGPQQHGHADHHDPENDCLNV
jgi:hypothetical protein